jgi:tetratricopeptide (TPR) repeat protein
MSRHYCIWTVIILTLQCATVFDRRNDFEKAIAYYQKADLKKAIQHFEKHHAEHPGSDTTLYYLYDCYRRQGDHDSQITTLEELTGLGTLDHQAYTVLLSHYQTVKAYDRFFSLYASSPASLKPILDTRYALTRMLYARLVVGATRRASLSTDPLTYTVGKGYLPAGPDGILYEQDTITMGNLIVALDNLLEPVYPARFYPMTHLSERSFLYLPYMRLINAGILEYEQNMDPKEPARVSHAVQAINLMVERGYLDQNH